MSKKVDKRIAFKILYGFYLPCFDIVESLDRHCQNEVERIAVLIEIERARVQSFTYNQILSGGSAVIGRDTSLLEENQKTKPEENH